MPYKKLCRLFDEKFQFSIKNPPFCGEGWPITNRQSAGTAIFESAICGDLLYFEIKLAMLEFLRNFSTQLACKFFTLTFVGCVHQRIVYCVMMVPLVKIIEKKFITPHEWFQAYDWNKYLLPFSSTTFLFIFYICELMFLNPKFYSTVLQYL